MPDVSIVVGAQQAELPAPVVFQPGLQLLELLPEGECGVDSWVVTRGPTQFFLERHDAIRGGFGHIRPKEKSCVVEQRPRAGRRLGSLPTDSR